MNMNLRTNCQIRYFASKLLFLSNSNNQSLLRIQTLALVACLLVCLFCYGCRPNPAVNQPPKPVAPESTEENARPEMDIRHMFQDVQLSDIKEIRLWGKQTGYTKDRPLAVSDRTICSQFLQSLKVAVWNGRRLKYGSMIIDLREFAGENNTINVVLNPKAEKKANILTVNYLPFFEEPYNHGTAFCEAMKALGDYQSQQMHTGINKSRSQITAVTLNIANQRQLPKLPKVITLRADEINPFLDDIVKSDGVIFSYLHPGLVLPVKLPLKDGTSLKYHFLIPHLETVSTRFIPAQFRDILTRIAEFSKQQEDNRLQTEALSREQWSEREYQRVHKEILKYRSQIASINIYSQLLPKTANPVQLKPEEIQPFLDDLLKSERSMIFSYPVGVDVLTRVRLKNGDMLGYHFMLSSKYSPSVNFIPAQLLNVRDIIIKEIDDRNSKRFGLHH